MSLRAAKFFLVAGVFAVGLFCSHEASASAACTGQPVPPEAGSFQQVACVLPPPIALPKCDLTMKSAGPRSATAGIGTGIRITQSETTTMCFNVSSAASSFLTVNGTTIGDVACGDVEAKLYSPGGALRASSNSLDPVLNVLVAPGVAEPGVWRVVMKMGNIFNPPCDRFEFSASW